MGRLSMLSCTGINKPFQFLAHHVCHPFRQNHEMRMKNHLHSYWQFEGINHCHSNITLSCRRWVRATEWNA